MARSRLSKKASGEPAVKVVRVEEPEVPTIVAPAISVNISERIDFIAEKLNVDRDIIVSCLPHLENPTPAELAEVPTPDKIAQYIDHTLLKATALSSDIEKLCTEARKHKFYAVCVNGCRVDECLELVDGSDVNVAAVIGFPLGAMTTTAKVVETKNLVKKGVQEIDMVLNVGKLLEGDYVYVRSEIDRVSQACEDALLKVIFETGELTDEQVADACILSALGGADFVKTSTGFGKGGATPEHIYLMKTVVGNELQVKASGGVRTLADAQKMIALGATRIGTSGGVTIVTQGVSNASY
ncbi:hypothetical protein RCL1_004945 [Eukaryota sp. TZLM3-RCL]